MRLKYDDEWNVKGLPLFSTPHTNQAKFLRMASSLHLPGTSSSSSRSNSWCKSLTVHSTIPLYLVDLEGYDRNFVIWAVCGFLMLNLDSKRTVWGDKSRLSQDSVYFYSSQNLLPASPFFLLPSTSSFF